MESTTATDIAMDAPMAGDTTSASLGYPIDLAMPFPSTSLMSDFGFGLAAAPVGDGMSTGVPTASTVCDRMAAASMGLAVAAGVTAATVGDRMAPARMAAAMSATAMMGAGVAATVTALVISTAMATGLQRGGTQRKGRCCGEGNQL